jgi:hypothetical protein
MSFLVPGGLKLAKLQRRDVQALIDRLTATLDAHTVRNAISPLRSICRHAISRAFAFPGYGRWGREYGPFSADALLRRSRTWWINADLSPIGLHEARHTFASMSWTGSELLIEPLDAGMGSHGRYARTPAS